MSQTPTHFARTCVLLSLTGCLALAPSCTNSTPPKDAGVKETTPKDVKQTGTDTLPVTSSTSALAKVNLDDKQLRNRPLETVAQGAWSNRRMARARPAEGTKGGGGKADGKGLLGVLSAAGEDAEAMPMPSSAAVDSADFGGLALSGRGAGGGGTSAGPGAAPPRAKRALSKPASTKKRRDSRRAPPKPMNQPALKAGSTDDNKDFDAYTKFLLTWSDRPTTAGQVQRLDVRDRTFIQVHNQAGKPIPMARVVVKDKAQDAIVWAGKTLGDGRLAYYPRIALPKSKGKAANGYVVEAKFGEAASKADWDGSGVPVVTLDVKRPVTEPLELDVLFVLDTTGSMSDELARIKQSLLGVTEQLKKLNTEFNLRYGAVLYRDVTDAYVTSTHPFTGDINAFSTALQQVSAGGGGDFAESLNQGLAVAVEQMQWRDNAVKLSFVIADAPPHMDYEQDVPYGESALRALEKGIKMHTVAASGLNDFGSLCFRQVAQLTRGKFIFIEYGGNIQKSAAKHGVSSAPQKSNNLDDILFEQVKEELANWGR